MKESRRAELEREMCMDTMLEIRNLTNNTAISRLTQ